MDVSSVFLETHTKTTLRHLRAAGSSETSENIYETLRHSVVSGIRNEADDNCSLLGYYSRPSSTTRRVRAQKNAVPIYFILQDIHGDS